MRKFIVQHRSVLLWILGGGFFLLYCFLAMRFTFWGDELTSIEYAKQSTGYFISNYFVNPDNHPPLYYFLLNIWQKIFQIGYHNDYWFQIFSIAGYFVAVMVTAQLWLKTFRERLYFIFLTGISSYFFIYSHMVRYYTLAAFVYMAVFFYLRKWFGSSQGRWLWHIVPLSCLLAYLDYTAYIFYGVTFIVFIIRYKFWGKLHLQQLIVFAVTQIVGVIPLLYLNYVYFTLRLQSSQIVEVYPALSIKKIVNFIGGLGSSLYQIIIGEYFTIYLTPVLIGILGIVLYFMIKEWRKKKKNEDSSKVLLGDLGLFVITNVIFASFFLTFIIGRYPIFSYVRFLMPVGFVLAIISVKLFLEKKRWIMYVILGVNIFTLSMNIIQRDFINPIFFFPQKLVVDYAQKNNLPVFSQVTPTRPSSYVVNKFLSPQVIYHSTDTSQSCFLVFTDNIRLGGKGVEVLDLPEEERSRTRVVSVLGYDTISSSTKMILHKFGLMNTEYKYYYSIIEKISSTSSIRTTSTCGE